MCMKQIKTNKQNKILDELFKLYEEKLYANSETNRKLTKQIVAEEEQFYNMLTEEQKEQFEQLSDLKQKNYEETDKNIFAFTFKLAINLMAECIF